MKIPKNNSRITFFLLYFYKKIIYIYIYIYIYSSQGGNNYHICYHRIMGAILSQSHIGPWLTTIHVKAHAKRVTINAIND